MPFTRHRALQLIALLAVVCAVTLGMLARPNGAAEAAGPISFRLAPKGSAEFAPDARDIAESAPGDAPLLVFLPATGAVPERYTRFLDTAHAAGFSVLGLDYPDNGASLARSCGPNMACYGDMLANRYDGSDPTSFSDVSSQNAILDRLDTSLAYLRTHDQAGDWQRYLRGTRPRWQRFVLAGHSQGGGMAAYIAHLHRVRGVLMFSAPAETMDGRTAGWLADHSATPASRMWALDDVHDIYAARIAPSWRELGITPGTPARLPANGHGLLTTLPLGTPGQAHGRVVSDRTPLDSSGTPVLEPVWQWMLDRVRSA